MRQSNTNSEKFRQLDKFPKFAAVPLNEVLCTCSGMHSQGKHAMVKADLEFPSPSVPNTTDETKEEEPKEENTIRKL